MLAQRSHHGCGVLGVTTTDCGADSDDDTVWLAIPSVRPTHPITTPIAALIYYAWKLQCSRQHSWQRQFYKNHKIIITTPIVITSASTVRWTLDTEWTDTMKSAGHTLSDILYTVYIENLIWKNFQFLSSSRDQKSP